MKQLMIIFVTLFSGVTLLYADSFTDSLRVAIEATDGQEKVSLINDLTYHFLLAGTMDMEKAERYGKEALKEAQRQQLTDDEAEAVSNLGQVKYYRGQYGESIEYQKRALALLNHDESKLMTGYCLSRIGHALSRLGRRDEMFDYMRDAAMVFMVLSDGKPASYVENYIGLAYWKTGEYDSALVHFNRALEIRETLTEYRETAKTLNNIGTVHYQRGNYLGALEYFLRAFEVNERIGNCRGVSLSQSNIGKVYLSRKKYERAMKHCRQSLAAGYECGDNDVIGYALNTIGQVHEARAHLDSALICYRKSLGYYRDDHHDAGIILSQNSIANVMNDMGRHEEALSIAMNALRDAENMNNPEYISSSFSIAGWAHHGMGNDKQAVESAENGLLYSLRANLHEKTKDIYAQLSDIYRNMGNSDKALQYYTMHVSLKDSLLNERTAWNMDRLRIAYESEKKERDNEKLRLEKQVNEAIIGRNRTIIVFTTLSLLLCACIAIILFLKNRQKKTVNRLLADVNLELSNKHDEILRKNTELEEAFSNIKVLSGLVPICAHCKKIRDDEGYWNQLEAYIMEHTDARFTHGICPECRDKVYNEFLNAEDDAGDLTVGNDRSGK